MADLLFWLYLVNATLLINHEIESAYWKEWELFRLPGGITLFIVLHLPLVFIVLWGLALLLQGSWWGLVISLVLSGSGVFAFCIHRYFVQKGHQQFTLAISQILLWWILAVSLAQAAVTVIQMVG